MVIDIADAVTAEINAAPHDTFTQSFTAVRRVLPEFDLADLSELKVSVVPKNITITGAARTASQYEIAVDIGVQKKLGKDLDSEVGVLVMLMDQIADYLCRRPLMAAPFVSWVSISNEPIYATDHLAQQRVFTSVLTVVYRAMKS
jgi:hypothetical protein